MAIFYNRCNSFYTVAVIANAIAMPWCYYLMMAVTFVLFLVSLTCSFRSRLVGNLIWLMCIVHLSIALNVDRLDPGGRNSDTTSSRLSKFGDERIECSLEIHILCKMRIVFWIHNKHSISMNVECKHREIIIYLVLHSITLVHLQRTSMYEWYMWYNVLDSIMRADDSLAMLCLHMNNAAICCAERCGIFLFMHVCICM